MLVYEQKSPKYMWTYTSLNKPYLQNWVYSANMGLITMDHEQTSSGLLFQAKNSGDKLPVHLMFMVNPGNQTFWFGYFNENTNEWKTLNKYEGTTYNIYSSAIKKFEKSDGAENFLSVQKSGDKIILKINNQVVQTIAINNDNGIINNVYGIGISTYQKGQGGVEKISFAVEN